MLTKISQPNHGHSPLSYYIFESVEVGQNKFTREQNSQNTYKRGCRLIEPKTLASNTN